MVFTGIRGTGKFFGQKSDHYMQFGRLAKKMMHHSGLRVQPSLKELIVGYWLTEIPEIRGIHIMAAG
jgi:hypothetical protein